METIAHAGGRFFVITGGPGSGKSTLIDALRRSGRNISAEVGRQIIQEQVSIGGRAVPWNDPLLFAEMMLSREMAAYSTHASVSGPVFFDRGVPDVVGYLRLLQLHVPPHMERAAALFRYNPRVFIAPPWRDIFAQDSERKQTFEEAQRTYDAMVATYGSLGYELIELPRAPVDIRLRLVLQTAQ